jgi:hypothetical protein
MRRNFGVVRPKVLRAAIENSGPMLRSLVHGSPRVRDAG